MRGMELTMFVIAGALCLSCSRADAQGAVISGDVSGSKALDETTFNFDNSGLGDASAESGVSGSPPEAPGSSAESRGADSLGTIVQLPAAPGGPPPPMPPPVPPYLTGLGSYGDVTAADVGAYPGVLNIAARAAALALPEVGPPFIQAALAATAQQVLDLVNPGRAGSNMTAVPTANGTAASGPTQAPSNGTSAGIEGGVSSPINEPSSSRDTRPDFPPGRATGAGTTEPSEGTTTVQLGVSSGSNTAERQSALQAAATMAAAAVAAALLLSAL